MITGKVKIFSFPFRSIWLWTQPATYSMGAGSPPPSPQWKQPASKTDPFRPSITEIISAWRVSFFFLWRFDPIPGRVHH
jgi:hypothetical protein